MLVCGPLRVNPIKLAWASVQGCTHTTTDMWRVFCSHVVDVENDYFVKDGLVEDLIEELVVEFGEDDGCDSDEEKELIDDKG